ncbi:MAG: hypothetical protein HY763_06365 [Planctomycetes bacterium]|nr:hypothetical protein [Planctomycetota bacterium]
MNVFGWSGLEPMDVGRVVPTSGDATAARNKVDELELKLDRALLTCEALWTLLRDKFGVSDVELVQRINELDLSDGRLDGKVRKSAVSCPKCGRAIARRFPKCMYCGQAVVHDPFV